MLKTIGGSSADLLTPVAKTGDKTAAAAAPGPSLIVIISLIILLSAGMSFVMIRWRMEGRMIFLEDSRKTMQNDVNIVRDSLATVAAGGGGAVSGLDEIKAKLADLEIAMGTSTQMIASNTAAIAAIEARQASGVSAAEQSSQAGASQTEAPMAAATVAAPVVTVADSKLCSGLATTISGRTKMPVDSKYAKLDILGQIFTAADCGEERLAQIPWLESSPKGGLQYSFGLSLDLAASPSPDLLAQLLVLGFDCETKSLFSVCRNWTANKVMTVEDLRKLVPFVGEISGDASLR